MAPDYHLLHLLSVFSSSVHEKLTAEKEIQHLKANLIQCEKQCEDLIAENSLLNEKLSVINASLAMAHEVNDINIKEIEIMQKQAIKDENMKKTCEENLVVLKKKHLDYECDSKFQITELKKTLKTREKEIHNLSSKLSN